MATRLEAESFGTVTPAYQVRRPAPAREPEAALTGPLVSNREYDEFRAWCETNHGAAMWREVAMNYKRLAGAGPEEAA